MVTATGGTAVLLQSPPTELTRPALFLDLDGVLAPLAETPQAVGPDPRRTAVLRALDQRLDGRVAVISGRTLSEIDRISERAAPSASGVHGLERRRRDGSLVTRDSAPGVAPALASMEAFAADRPGVIVEDKGVSAGLHYRQTPGEAGAAVDLARALAAAHGLSLQLGDMVAELKTPGSDKGQALTAFMAEAPFAGATPVMLGDDLTDEDGFRAAAAMGGFGVLVGPPRETAARYGLPDVDAVLEWLETLRTPA